MFSFQDVEGDIPIGNTK